MLSSVVVVVVVELNMVRIVYAMEWLLDLYICRTTSLDRGDVDAFAA
jgi:hypothetical protein